MQHLVTFRNELIIVFHVDTELHLKNTVEFRVNVCNCRFLPEDTLLLAGWLKNCYEGHGEDLIMN